MPGCTVVSFCTTLDIRPHRRRFIRPTQTWTVKSYSPDGAIVHPRNTCFLGPNRVHNPNGILIGLAIFAQLAAVLSGTHRHVLSPENCSIAWGSRPHLIHGSSSPQPKQISIVSAVFAQLTAVSLVIPGHVLSPKNCLFAWGSGPSFNTIPSVHPSLIQMASRSVQPFLHSAQQTVSILHNGRPFRPTLPLPMEILQSIRNSISISLPVCAQLEADSPYTLQLAPLSPKLRLPIGDLDPHLIHGSLVPPEFSTQKASRLVQPFLQGSLV